MKSRKSEKPDVAIIYSEYPASCAAMFTTNKFCAAPVILDREILKKGKARAVVINSGNANAATGEQGIKNAKLVETEAEKLLGLGEDEELPEMPEMGEMPQMGEMPEPPDGAQMP